MTESSGVGASTRIARNAGVVLVARGANIIIRLVTISLIASYLGKAGFGFFSYVVSLGEIFAVLSDFGVIRVGVREIARDKENASEQFGNVLVLKGLLALVTFGIVLIFAWGTRMEPSLRSGVAIYTLAVVVNYYANSFFVFYRAFERMEFEAILIILERTLYLGLAVAAVRLDLGLQGVFVANLLASVVKLVAAPLITHFGLIKLSFRIRASSVRRYFQESIPIGISMFLASVYLRVDVLILEHLRDSAEVGVFSGAYRIIDATMLLPVVIVSALFPVLSRRAEASREVFHQFVSQAFKLLLLVALPIAVVMVVWAEPIVGWVLDRSFTESVLGLRLLAVVLVLSYLNFLFNYVMTAVGKQTAYAVVVALSLTLNIVVAYLLIPTAGYIGACLATIAAEATSFALAMFLLKRYANYSLPFGQIWKSLAAALLMAGIATLGVFWDPVWSLVLVAPLAGLAYLTGLVLLRALSRDEVRGLRLSLFHLLRLRPR